jgi:AcrR family transcriptional regulator
MQFAKEDIKKRILAAAKEEFLQSGFEKASIRKITADAQTSKSNLYNYFRDKDALFAAVLEPTVQSILNGLDLARRENASTGVDAYTMQAQMRNMQVVMEFVSQNAADIMLLLFHAGGSSLSGFRHLVADRFTDVLMDWLAHAMPQSPPSRFFVRCVSGFYINIIEQLMQARVSPAQAREYFGEFLRFIYSGWSGVMHAQPSQF